MVLLSLISAGALAEDGSIPIAFEPPPEIPLFLKAEILATKGVARGEDCRGALEAAIAEAAGSGQLVRVVRSEEELSSAEQATCKLRKAGDKISASVVSLHSLVIVPGAPATVYPILTPERTVEIVEALGQLHRDGVASVPIDDIGGKAWVRLPPESLSGIDASQQGERARAMLAHERFIVPRISRWFQVLEAIPEVQGIVMEVEVISQDPAVGRKSRLRELFRFMVPTALARQLLQTEMGDTFFLSKLQVERASNAKRRDFQSFEAVDPELFEPPEPAGVPEPAEVSSDVSDLPEDGSASDGAPADPADYHEE